MQGRTLNTRVFLEGIEVDVVSVQVQGGLNQPATALIEIPAVDAAHRLLPRTLVHVFYMETSHVLADPTDQKSPVSPDSGQTTNRNNWRLLFAGEVLGYRYVSVGANRQVALQCQDFTSYWQLARLYWGTNNLSLHTYKTTIAAGALQAYSGKKKVDSTDALLNLVMAKPATIPRLTGVLGGLVSLLESATGVFHPDARDRFRGVSDFMSQAELRLHLTQMLGAAPDDTTSAKFIDSVQFKQYLRRMARSIGQTASFMDLVGLFMQRIYYGWSSLPAPPFFPAAVGGTLATKRAIETKTAPRKNQAIKDHLALIDQLRKALRVRFNASDERKRVPSGRQVGAVRGDGDGCQYSAQPIEGTPTPDTQGYQAFNTSAGPFHRTSWEQAAQQARAEVGTDQTALSRFDTVAAGAYPTLVEVNRLLGYIVSNPVHNHTGPQLRRIDALLAQAERALKAWRGGGTLVRREVDAQVAVGDRLNAHLFAPDLYMAPPPTCNVLFPDHYTQISFSREWMSELTRMVLHTKTSTGQDTKQVYFAPNTDIWGGPNDTDVVQAIKKGVSFLMEHERYTGVLAAIESIGDVSIFKRIHEDVKKEVKKDDPTGKSDVEVSGEALFSPMEHVRRAANYLFFAKRFGGRSMQVRARFSPQIVPGLPMLVLDPVRSSEVAAGEPPHGTHFVGLVASVTHVLDGRGHASTDIQLVKCREHREGLDVFNPTTDEATVGRVQKTVVTRTGKVRIRKRYGGVNRLPDSKSSSGATFSVVLLDDRYAGRTQRPGDPPTTRMAEAYDSIEPEAVVETVGFRPAKGKSYEIEVLSFTNVDAGLAADRELLNPEAGSPATTGQVQELVDEVLVKVTETTHTTVTKKNTFEFSFEQTATPPWLAEIYLPFNIGEHFYRPLLGCGSVLDASPLNAAPAPKSDVKYDRFVVSMVDAYGNAREVEVPEALIQLPITTQQAADNLADAWLSLTRSGADVSRFVDAYTSRSFATLPHIMGDVNPVYWLPGRDLPPAGSKLEGFHGNAFGPYDGLTKWDGTSMLPGSLPTATGSADTMPKVEDADAPLRDVDGTVDPRRARHQAVMEYRNELIGGPK